MTDSLRSTSRQLARTGACAAVLLAVAMVAGGALAAEGQTGAAVAWRRSGTIGFPGLTEASGLAARRAAPGLLYAHNDSGHWPLLHVFDRAGNPRGSARIPALPLDWEDLAAARVDGRALLLVADTGDHLRARERALLFLLEEPDLRTDPGGSVLARGRSVRAERGRLPAPRLFATIGVTYPGGPADVEAAAIDADGGRVILAERTGPGAAARLFAVPLPGFPHPEPAEGKGEAVGEPRRLAGPWTLAAEAVVIGRLRLPPITGMDISPEGRRCVCVSLHEGFLFRREEGEGWEAAFGRAPERIPLPELPQIEAVCFGAEGSGLFLTSETRGGGMPELWRGGIEEE